MGGREVQGWLLSKSRRKEMEGGEKGLPFIRGDIYIQCMCIWKALYLVATRSHLGCC